jgi:hypothetical protein
MDFKAAGRLKPMHPLHKGRFTPLSRSSALRAMSRLSGGGREVFPTAVCSAMALSGRHFLLEMIKGDSP